ncbi:hypothetical protein GCM10028856_10420 [Halopiger thermotolerans]
MNSYISEKAEKETESLSVETRVENAKSATVTADVLTSTSPEDRGNYIEKRFVNESLITYLGPREQPHFVFHAKSKAARKDGESVLKPDPSGGLAICFTDERILLVAGQEDGDSSVDVTYSELDDYETSTGRLKHRITVSSADGTEYDIYVANHYGSDDLAQLSDFLAGTIAGTGEGDEDASSETGDASEDSGDEPDEEANDECADVDEDEEEEYRTETDEKRIASLLADTENDSVSRAKLEGIATQSHEPIVRYLEDGEAVRHVFTDKSGGVTEFKEDETNRRIKPYGSSNTAYIFTDERIVAVVPQSDGDEVVEIPYDALVDYNTSRDIYFKYQDPTLGVSRIKIGVKTETKRYEFRIRVTYLEECREWIRFVRKEMHDEYEEILLSAELSAEKPKLGLSILDRETGEAEMETSGWEYGVGFVEREQSTSKIEKKGYQTYASDFVVTDDGIQVVFTEANEGGTVRMHRSYHEIGKVDLTSSGFIIYCRDGIYKFDYHYEYEEAVDPDRMKEVGEHLRERVRAANEPEREPGTADDRGEADELDKLERLAELKEQGVITESEFEEKKSELLDSI